MTLGRSDQLQVGDEVLAIGNPLGLQQTVTHGIVSAIDRKQLGVATFENFIQTDAAINDGNSGGALINAARRAGGHQHRGDRQEPGRTGVEGIGFAIPVNLVRGVMREILAHGHVVRGWIGIVPEDFSDEQAAQFGLPHGGVVITNLYRNGPAAAARAARRRHPDSAIDGHDGAQRAGHAGAAREPQAGRQRAAARAARTQAYAG